MTTKAENRRYFTAAAFAILLVAVVLFLVYVEIPEGNRDVILVLIGVIATGGTDALKKLFGDDDDERDKVAAELHDLSQRYDVLKANYDALTALLVDKHIIDRPNPVLKIGRD